jgi:hypothetical protein
MLSQSEVRRILENHFYYGLLRYKGETYKATHEPLISKKTFDECQEVFARRGRPQRHRKGWFPFLGLAKCKECGCSITAERQKGRHYYRCSKKRGKCSEPFTREEKLSEQIEAALSRIGFCDEVYERVMKEWIQERDGSRQDFEAQSKEVEKKVANISLKLDRLLDAHLEGVITQEEYLARKERFLNQKIQLEGELQKSEGEAVGWLEPAREFIEDARKAYLLAMGAEKTAQKEFLKKVGSNFSMSGRTLEFSYDFPWSVLARKGRNQKWRGSWLLARRVGKMKWKKMMD